MLQKDIEEYIHNRQHSIPITVSTFSSSAKVWFDLDDRDIADIYILDIDMPQIDGIELATHIRKKNPLAMIFFYTAHTEYATEGYKVEAMRYIVKGSSQDLLYEALDYAVHKFSISRQASITVNFNRDSSRIPLAEITYVQREGHLLYIHTRTLGTYTDPRGIKDFFGILKDPHFIFIDRGIIVNIDFIQRTESNEIVMYNNERLGISRRNITQVKNAIAALWN